jgi:hypothetical protein
MLPYYKPLIKFETGRITHLIFEGKNKKSKDPDNTTFIIRTQQLITSSIDRPIRVNSEKIYNVMHNVMRIFNKIIFQKSNKSYYTNLDIDILNEYRTVANSGLLSQIPKNLWLR